MASALLPLLVVVLAVQVAGHGRLTQPSSRGVLASKPEYMENAPVSSNVGTDFVCRNDAAAADTNWPTYTVGQSVVARWNLPAPHVGDCFFYMTLDGDKPVAQQSWFKVAEIAYCEQFKDTDYSLTIPSYLPSSAHAIVRWEWYGLHVRPTIEWYCQCWDIKLTGTPTGTLPGPRMSLPGHLPSDGYQYRNGFGGSFFFTGPPVATEGYTGAPYVCCNDSTQVPPPTPTTGRSATPTTGRTAGTPAVTTGYVNTPNPDTTDNIGGDATDDSPVEVDGDEPVPCTTTSDCGDDGVCGIDQFCHRKPSGGLGSGGIGALVMAGLLLVVVGVLAAFFYVNKSELPYMKPFRGRI
eukprot:TRINITY_DN384_c0_g1_i1.p1 TRINITY_DN384_c0_g1~~TRINITY_DN384_c0_g1_i1.p1  ORF type:complete len:362 (+),score=65.38 TRINITY_DN384_c0_g1_i1:35-1087(+)